MPVPLNVMQSAAQGDREAMRLVEQEYGVGNGQNYAIDYLSEEEPPPTNKSKGEYSYKGKEQVRKGEAEILADKLSRLKKKSDIEDVLLKVAAEDAELAENTGKLLVKGGIALTAASVMGGAPATIMPTLEEVVLAGSIGGSGGAFTSIPIGEVVSEQIRPSEPKEQDARERMQSIELSPEAQKIYDEYKAKGYSPTYYKTK